jgi:hypothetical protein
MTHYSNTNNPVDFPKTKNKMNERIKELAKQAGVPMEYSFVDGATVWNLHPSVEEFAELIVRKCASICFSEAEGHDMAFGQHCGVVIKEHFGVE